MDEYCPRLPMNHTLLARVCREDKEAKKLTPCMGLYNTPLKHEKKKTMLSIAVR